MKFGRIRHFHISHNTPYLPPKFCKSIVFSFSWDGCNAKEKLKLGYAKFGGRGRGRPNKGNYRKCVTDI